MRHRYFMIRKFEMWILGKPLFRAQLTHSVAEALQLQVSSKFKLVAFDLDDECSPEQTRRGKGSFDQCNPTELHVKVFIALMSLACGYI